MRLRKKNPPVPVYFAGDIPKTVTGRTAKFCGTHKTARPERGKNTENRMHIDSASNDSFVARFLRTDLACEAPDFADIRTENNAYFEYRRGTVTVARLTVESEETAARFGKPPGTYVTVTLGDPLLLSHADRTALTGLISAELCRMAEFVTGKPPKELSSVLVAGLGNAQMTADALGPRTTRGILVTRHLQNRPDGTASPAFTGTAVAAIAPGVLA